MEIVKEPQPQPAPVQHELALMPPPPLILMLLALPSKLDVLQLELDVLLHWDHALHIQEQHQLAPNLSEVMETAQPPQPKLQQLLVLRRYALMLLQQLLQMQHAKHFHINVSQMELDV